MTQGSRIEDESVIRCTDLHFADMLKRMVKRRPHVVEKRTRGGDEVVLAGEAESVLGQHLEVPREAIKRRVDRKGPRVN